MKNELKPGQPRIGALYDGDKRTPQVSVLLEDTSERVQITVPTGGLAARDPYDRWFSGSMVHHGDDPDRTRYAYKPPRVALFTDAAGPVALVGCRPRGSTASLSGGRGIVEVDFAVLGARHADYARINGVRVEMPALSAWTRLESVHVTPETNDLGRVESLVVRLKSPEPVRLSRRVNLGLRPTWRTSRNSVRGTFEAHDVVELMTATKQAREWGEHLEAIAGVRDLMSLSAWKPFGFSRVDVNRGDDPKTVLSGDAIGERWAQVVSHRFPQHTDWQKEPGFLFEYPEIGPVGVDRWLRIRRHFSRSFGPLVAVLDQPGAYVETKLVQTGIALEALGYQLLRDAKKIDAKKRQATTYWGAADAVLEDMKYVPLENPDDWKARSNKCYRGVKHADNPVPETLDLFNTYRENVLVLRYWLAGRLGLSKSTLAERLASDPLGSPYRLADDGLR